VKLFIKVNSAYGTNR